MFDPSDLKSEPSRSWHDVPVCAPDAVLWNHYLSFVWHFLHLLVGLTGVLMRNNALELT